MPVRARCPNTECGKVYLLGDEETGKQFKCPACGTVMTVPDVPATAAMIVGNPPEGDTALRVAPTFQPPGLLPIVPPRAPVRHSLKTFPTALVILLHYVSLGIFTTVWLNLMHGKMPRIRADDPSAARAIGFLFIPFFNFYWVFFTYHRLCVRINEQRARAGLVGRVPTGLAITMCIVMLIPYVGVVCFLVLAPIFAGIVQSRVNELVRATGRA